MLREVTEETGLNNFAAVSPTKDLVYTHQKEGLVTTKMYCLVVNGIQGTNIEFENDRLEWVPINEVCDRLSYDNLKQYFMEVKSDLLEFYNQFTKNNLIIIPKS
jgi:hypothetical protein